MTYRPLVCTSLNTSIARISYCDDSCKTAGSTLSMSSPWAIYRFKIEIIALSELNIISPDFSSNFGYDFPSIGDEWKAKALIFTFLSLINGLILDSRMFK